jgi:hypothetical protein
MDEEIKQAQKVTLKNNKSIWYFVGFIAVVLIAFVGFQYLPKQGTAAVLQDNSNQKIIEQTVSQIKSTTTFPQKSSKGAMILNDVKEEPNAIRYEYSIDSPDASQLSSSVLKGNIVPALCTNSGARRFLDMGINMEYSYSVEGSAQTFFFSVSKKDCL